MSLDVYLTELRPVEVFEANITHNLNKMADEAGIYEALWRPEDLKINKAVELIPLLEKGLELLKSDEKRFRKFDAANGWGRYEHFVPFVEKYLEACRESPGAEVSVSR